MKQQKHMYFGILLTKENLSNKFVNWRTYAPKKSEACCYLHKLPWAKGKKKTMKRKSVWRKESFEKLTRLHCFESRSFPTDSWCYYFYNSKKWLDMFSYIYSTSKMNILKQKMGQFLLKACIKIFLQHTLSFI